MLNPIDETKGWLGNRTDYKIGKYDCYPDNQHTASWMPDEEIAITWQKHFSDATTVEIANCSTIGTEWLLINWYSKIDFKFAA